MTSGSNLTGRTIAGRFRVIGLIGEGAMAAVYRGEQDAEPREVAIKIMHPQLLGDATFVGRFRREAKAASRLRHPNTVQIIDSGVEGHLPYLVMELLKGKDLFDVLAEERRLSQARAARILIAICDALIAAHEHGIIHRDLKPENVMLFRDPADPSVERVKVLDFGIAKMVEGGTRPGDEGSHSSPNSLSNQALTTVGVVVGTPAYMSPEQCRGDPIDGRSDVYACGVLLFSLVTGRLPFPPTDIPWEVAMDHLRKPPPAPSQFLPHIHPGLEAVILTALEKWPQQRQQSALDLRDELQRLLPELTDSVRPAGAPGALKDAPTIESIPVSIRSRVTVAPPLRDVELPPPAPAEGGGRDAPSSLRHGRAATSEPQSAPPTLVNPSPVVITVAPRAGAVDIARPAPGGEARAQLAPAAIEPRRSDFPPPTSEQPPSSEFVIQDRAEIAALLAAPRAVGAAGPAAPGWEPTAPAARPPLASSGGAEGKGARAEPPPRLRRPPTRPTDALAVRLVVPMAVVIGLVLGLLAFFLTR